MSEVENATAYLVEFYPEMAAILDLPSIQLASKSFMQPALKLFKADVVYRCKFKGSEEELYFVLLWEHKSKPDKYVAIQVGLYILLTLYEMTKAEDPKLEPILPLVFYNGKEDWQPKTIVELFEEHPFFDTFKQYLPTFDFLFNNISSLSTEELLQLQVSYFSRAMTAMAFRFRPGLLLKNISFIFEENDRDRLLTLAVFFFAVIDRSPNYIQEQIKNIEFTTKSKVMSTLAQLKAEGKIEGILYFKRV